MKNPKPYDDLTEEQKEQIKKIVIKRIKQLPDNLKLSIG